MSLTRRAEFDDYYIPKYLTSLPLQLQQLPLVQISHNLPHRILNAHLMTFNMNLRRFRRFIRRTHARKLLDLPRPSPFVQPLRIPLLRHTNRHIDKHLHKRQRRIAIIRPDLHARLRRMQIPRNLAIGPVRRDKARDGDHTAVGEELGNLGYPPDVLVAVRFGEPEVFVQPEADVVAVETVGGDAEVQKVLFESDRDGRFAGGGKPGKPQCEAALLAESEPFGPRQERGVVCDVAVRNRCQSMEITWGWDTHVAMMGDGDLGLTILRNVAGSLEVEALESPGAW